jgi:hypothetical protein
MLKPFYSNLSQNQLLWRMAGVKSFLLLESGENNMFKKSAKLLRWRSNSGRALREVGKHKKVLMPSKLDINNLGEKIAIRVVTLYFLGI